LGFYIHTMKVGGISYSGSPHKKKGVESRAKCKYCSREYKMDWARNNHEKLCGERGLK
jgi:hypothetical protein